MCISIMFMASWYFALIAVGPHCGRAEVWYNKVLSPLVLFIITDWRQETGDVGQYIVNCILVCVIARVIMTTNMWATDIQAQQK